MNKRIMGVDYSEKLEVGSFCIIDKDINGINIVEVDSVKCSTSAEFGSIIESIAKAYKVDVIAQDRTFKFTNNENKDS